jgi:hypothetical protein
MSKSTSRNSRSGFGGRGQSGVLGDPRVLGFRPHRSWPVQVAVTVWRWSAELVLLACLLYLMHAAEADLGVSSTVFLLVLAVVLVALTFYGPTRRVLGGVFWVFVTRHRLRTFFVEARIFNRSGKLPWVLTAYPTPVGERCWVWLMPGLSVQDLENTAEQIATATWARTARIERHRSRGGLIRVDVIRRDPLTAGGALPSVLIPATGNGADDQQTNGSTGTADGSGVVLDLPRPVIDLRDLGVTIPRGSRKGSSTGGGAPIPAPSPVSPAAASDGSAEPVSPWSRTASAGPVARSGGEDVSDYV